MRTIILSILLSLLFHNRLVSQNLSWEKAPTFSSGTQAVFATHDDLIIVQSGSSIYRSDDRGITWSVVGTLNGKIMSLREAPTGVILAATFGQGVFRSTDAGTTWSNIGLAGIQVWDVLPLDNGKIFAGTEGSGVQRSTDNGTGWQDVSGNSTSSLVWSLVEASDGSIVAGTQFGGGYRSTDGGNSWSDANTGMTDFIIQALVRAPNGDVYAGTYQHGVFRSTNNGKSWAQTTLNSKGIVDFAVTSTGTIFTSVDDFQASHISTSSDNGSTWTTVPGSEGTLGLALTVDSHGDVYATASTGLFRIRSATSGVEEVTPRSTNDLQLNLVSKSAGELHDPRVDLADLSKVSITDSDQ